MKLHTYRVSLECVSIICIKYQQWWEIHKLLISFAQCTNADPQWMYRRERGGLTRAPDLCMWQAATPPSGHRRSWMLEPYGEWEWRSLVKATPFVHSINNNIKLYFSFITLLLSLAINVNVSEPTKDTAPRSGQLNVCMCMYNVRTHINTRTHTHWCMYVCVCVRVLVSAYRGMCVGDGIHQLQLQLGQQ